MKKIIKDWWPLLLIAVWWVWKKFLPNKSIHLNSDKEQRLINAGFAKADKPCPNCGGVMYIKGYSSNKSGEYDFTGEYGFNLQTYCTTPGCPYCLPDNPIL